MLVFKKRKVILLIQGEKFKKKQNTILHLYVDDYEDFDYEDVIKPKRREKTDD